MSAIIKSTRFIRLTDETCRICLRDLQKNLLKDLSDEAENLQEVEPKTLAEIYEQCTGYKIAFPRDGPKKLCVVCAATLVKLFTFKQEIDIAEASLLQLCSSSPTSDRCEVISDTENPETPTPPLPKPRSNPQMHSVAVVQVQEEHLDNLYDDEVQTMDQNEIIDPTDYAIANEAEIEFHDENYQDGDYGPGESEDEDKFAARMITIPGPTLAAQRIKATEQKFSNLKPFECPICHKRFGTGPQLKQHLQSHRDERNFECKMCGKRFKTRKTLRGHEETHSTEIKYICGICKQGFTHKTAIRVHAFRVHSVRMLTTAMAGEVKVLQEVGKTEKIEQIND